MRLEFFAECTTIDEVKAMYKTLAKLHHPDKGGNLETMQAINREYAFISARIASGRPNATVEEVEAEILNAEAYRQALEKIINLEGLEIELVGTWIWVTGETRKHKDVLSSQPNRFFWASKKLAWYFRADEFKVKNKTKMSLDEIRYKYGTQNLNNYKPKNNYITN